MLSLPAESVRRGLMSPGCRIALLSQQGLAWQMPQGQCGGRSPNKPPPAYSTGVLLCAFSHREPRSMGCKSRPSPGRGAVVVSFARHRFSQTQSFPRKRESTPPARGNSPTTDWIPSFAGMTNVLKGIPFQMTPLPKGLGACRPGKSPACSAEGRRHEQQCRRHP